MTSRRFVIVTTAAVILGLAAIGSQRASAIRPAMKSPTVVVAVNLPKVLDGLKQRADAEQNLKKMTDEMNVERDRREQEAKKITEDRKTLAEQISNAADAATKTRLQDQFDRMSEHLADVTFNNQAWAKYATDKLDVERSLLLEDLYRSIKAAVQKMAADQGYDIVLVDDSQGELTTSLDSRVPRETQIRQQIADRRMLHASATADVTAELIDYMNNARAATSSGN